MTMLIKVTICIYLDIYSCVYICADQDFDKSKVLEFTYTIVVITKPFGIMRKDIKATEC